MSINPASSKPTVQVATTAMPNPSSTIVMRRQRLLLSLLTRLPQRAPSAQLAKRDQGLSLIECLVAIVVVSITLIAITPPIFFITATRVQSRKAEQALQVAQAEIDRVRAVVERGVYTAADLPEVVGSISNVPAPTSIAAGVLKSSTVGCNTYTGVTVAATALLPVSTDLDPSNLAACQSQFLVQTFRTAGPPPTGLSGFRLGVRVYSDNPLLRQNLGGLQTAQASLRFVSGLGDQNRRPLAILYSTIVRNDTSNSLQDYSTVCSTPDGC
ncbi:type II secretion system protein [Leptolyngbya sp. FACHB-321]|uniref:type IV pilus modification PilV family protein n=1 Tax=Leptolyngbya sp. FACHB-321 TaxID=2692807 RepID=UPI001687D3CA|nr:type II secretion system protein [Leptolyngbya sp. FACHB-321]MBD2035095.1 type II secretion system protein [Leptolyngbya sp. FACHB-321]